MASAPAEGGLGRVLAELGLPGLFCLLWLAIGLLRIIRAIVREARTSRRRQAVLIYGLVSFIPSHAVVFVTAHQVYGDPFVLLVLGAFVGFAMSARRIAALEAVRAARARIGRHLRRGGGRRAEDRDATAPTLSGTWRTALAWLPAASRHMAT